MNTRTQAMYLGGLIAVSIAAALLAPLTEGLIWFARTKLGA